MRFRFISIVLVIAMLFSLSVPAFAAENNAIQPNDPIIVSDARSKDSYITQFDQIGDALYYYEETDEYIVAIGVLDDVTDYSIRYKDNPATSNSRKSLRYFSSRNVCLACSIRGRCSIALGHSRIISALDAPFSTIARIVSVFLTRRSDSSGNSPDSSNVSGLFVSDLPLSRHLPSLRI